MLQLSIDFFKLPREGGGRTNSWGPACAYFEVCVCVTIGIRSFCHYDAIVGTVLHHFMVSWGMSGGVGCLL